MIDRIKYHSTGQFRNAIRNVRQIQTYTGQDKNGNPMYNPDLAKSVKYTGTVKLHGTNASVIFHEDGKLSFHSKEKTLAVYDEFGELHRFTDNEGFAFHFSNSKSDAFNQLCSVLSKACAISRDLYGEIVFPIKLSGEWAGQGIQKGVAINGLPKAFYIFGMKIGDTVISVDHGVNVESGWLPISWLNELMPKCNEDLKKVNECGIYVITQFPTYEITIDPNNPIDSQQQLIDITNEVEACCPVAKQRDVTGVGEGVVWVPNDASLIRNTGTWFKVKGNKHSSSKVKKLASVDVEKLNTIREFIEYAVTDNRIEQAIVECGMTTETFVRTKTGDVVRWVMNDIIKEEIDTMQENGIEPKQIGSHVSKAVNLFLSNL